MNAVLIASLVALASPLASASAIALVAPLRRRGMPAALVSVAAATTSLAAAIVALIHVLEAPGREMVRTVAWLPDHGTSLASIGVRLDGTSGAMLLVVCFVALAVQIFSTEYMREEARPAIGRYFAYQSLFLFAMSVLVVAPNLVQLFAGWELVGVTSYLLIGYYYQKPSAARAAVKAFWTTRLADVGFVAALMVLFATTGGFDWNAPLTEERANTIALLLFVAVAGKSAQFPLHVWLPDAMEGPTPVSALLHAATMVAAGVFLVVRCFPIFEHAPTASLVMAYVGAFTALFAASIATVQTDLKRVLAYSTCSQLGYMICALGAGSRFAGFFHLGTHAFFKALLFLSAGSVIHAVHTNEMRSMGGLARKMPLTAVAFAIGALSLLGAPGFSGFFSKDLVLESVAERGLYVPLFALLAAAFLTAFYVTRAFVITFLGKPSKHAEHAHESPFAIALPLVALAIPATLAGTFGASLARASGSEWHAHTSALGIAAIGFSASGLLLAWARYGRRAGWALALSPPVEIVDLVRSRLVDRAYEFAFARVVLPVSRGVGWIDRYVIDGLVNAVGWSAAQGSRKLRTVQTGQAQDYVYAVAAGAAAFALWGALR